MRPRWRKVVRDLSSHWFRTVLVVLSIVIGIFAVGVMLGGREILLREFDADHAASIPANVTYRTDDFGEDLAARASEEPGVSAAQARRSATFRYRWDDVEENRTISLEAFRDFEDISVSRVVAADNGVWPPAPGEVVLEASALQVAEYAVGDVLSVERADGETVELTVAGFAHDINSMPAQFAGYETGYISFGTMASLGEADRYNRLSLTFADDGISWAAASRLAIDLRERIFESDGVRVYHTDVPEPGSHFLGDIFSALSLLLVALGGLSLGLSAFLVINTVSSLMAQQVRQVGIMKSIGGSAGQLEWLYVVMVGIYGALAVAIGLPATAAGTRWFTDFAAEILNFRVASYATPAWVIAVEVAVGLAVPLLAAAVPIRRGTRMSVVTALNATGVGGKHFGHTVVDRVLGMIRGLPRPVALSLRNTFLRKGRLALTLSTLVLASGVVMAVWSVQASIERTISDLETWWNYDVEVDFAVPLDAASVAAAIEDVDGVVASETWPVFGATVVHADGSENESFVIVGLDPETDFVGPTLVEGRWLTAEDPDGIVINTDAHDSESSLAVGGSVTLRVLGQERSWPVVGVVRGQMGGPAIYCSAGLLAETTRAPGVTRLLVRGADSDAEAERALLADVEERLSDAGLRASATRTRADLAGQLREWLGILVAFLVLMAALIATVGVIGLTGTMSINVMESTREIGVMRATGAQHGAIYQIYVTEGATIGAIAWFLGALASYPLSVALVRALEGAIGMPLTYSFSWSGVLTWLVLMLAISAAASLAPAFRASRVSVRDAIAYE